MNESTPHPNESYLEDRMTKKGLKNLKSLPILTKCIFLFGGLIIGSQ